MVRIGDMFRMQHAERFARLLVEEVVAFVSKRVGNNVWALVEVSHCSLLDVDLAQKFGLS